MNDAKTLAKIVAALETPRPVWLPSEQWESLQRNGAVITPERAEAIKKAIKEAPEANIGAALTQIIGILGAFL